MNRPSSLALLAILALWPPMLLAGQPRTATSWGAVIGGLQVGVSASADNQSAGLSVEVSLRNVGPDDFTLNLGHMLANGKVMFPEAVQVRLTRSSGPTCELRYFDRRYAAVGGRVDDFMIALAAGAVYTLRLPGDRLWCAETQEPQSRLAPDRYRLTARFEGRGPLNVNLDMKGIALLTFWTGKAESDQAVFDVAR